MKVIILNNWGGRIPKMLKSYVNGGNNWRWGKAVSFIETNAVNSNGMNPHDIKTNVICYPGTDASSRTYLFKDENIIISVVDVDISRPWSIECYDGSEYIQYLDYTYIDKSINFCEIPKS